MREEVFALEMRLQIYFLLSFTLQNEAQLVTNYPFSGTKQQLQVCQGIFSLVQDQNGIFGLVTIENPNYFRNILIVELYLATRLTDVSKRTISSNKFAIFFFVNS